MVYRFSRRTRCKASPAPFGNAGSGGRDGTPIRSPLRQPDQTLPATSEQLFDCRLLDLLISVFGAPDRTGSTAGRHRPAPWNPRSGFEGEDAIQGDVSRPEQSGGRVTTTERKMIARGCLSPTLGGDRQTSGPPWRKRRSVRGFAARSRLRKSPRTGASERSEVAPGVGKEKKTGAPSKGGRAERPRVLCGRGAGRNARGTAVRAQRGLPGPGNGEVPNAGGAGRSPRSGRPAWPGGREGAPPGRTGADASGRRGGAERSAARPRRTMATAREGRGERRGRRCTKPVGSDAAARPRRLQRRPPTEQIFETSTQNQSSRLRTKHADGK